MNVRKSIIAQKQLNLRNQLWPKLDEKKLWSRQGKTGFTTVPRTMPLLLTTMNDLSPKGKPVSSTYLDLWCRTFDNSFVILNKEKEMAFHAGFSGQRGVQTWTERLRILAKLKFIDVKEGPSGPLSYALIWNPYQVIKGHYERKTPGTSGDLYHALIQRANEIGADDLV